MARQITVYPTKRSALLVHHPAGGANGGQAVQSGVTWPNDGFAARMLVEGIVTTDPTKGYQGEPHPLEAKMKERLALAKKRVPKKKK
jgi:hypothetical protein